MPIDTTKKTDEKANHMEGFILNLGLKPWPDKLKTFLVLFFRKNLEDVWIGKDRLRRRPTEKRSLVKGSSSHQPLDLIFQIFDPGL